MRHILSRIWSYECDQLISIIDKVDTPDPIQAPISIGLMVMFQWTTPPISIGLMVMFPIQEELHRSQQYNANNRRPSCVVGATSSQRRELARTNSCESDNRVPISKKEERATILGQVGFHCLKRSQYLIISCCRLDIWWCLIVIVDYIKKVSYIFTKSKF